MTDRTYEEGWAAAIEEAAVNMAARGAAERMMRDEKRREKNDEIAEMHADRAQAFDEAASAIRALRPPAPPEPLLRCECGGEVAVRVVSEGHRVGCAARNSCMASTAYYPTEPLARASWNGMQRRGG